MNLTSFALALSVFAVSQPCKAYGRALRASRGEQSLASRLVGTTPPVELVVATWAENVSWIDSMLGSVTPEAGLSLYCKSSSITDPRCIYLRNKGTEEYAYLTHILKNYDRLAPITVFAPGSMGQLSRLASLNRTVADVATQLKRDGFQGFATYGQAREFDPNFDIQIYKTFTGGPPNFLCKPTTRPLWKWYQSFVSQNLSHAVCTGFSERAFFAVTADRIRRYPRMVYQRLLDEIERCPHSANVAGHYIERIWRPMFDDCGAGHSLKAIASLVLEEAPRQRGSLDVFEVPKFYS